MDVFAELTGLSAANKPMGMRAKDTAPRKSTKQPAPVPSKQHTSAASKVAQAARPPSSSARKPTNGHASTPAVDYSSLQGLDMLSDPSHHDKVEADTTPGADVFDNFRDFAPVDTRSQSTTSSPASAPTTPSNSACQTSAPYPSNADLIAGIPSTASDISALSNRDPLDPASSRTSATFGKADRICHPAPTADNPFAAALSRRSQEHASTSPSPPAHVDFLGMDHDAGTDAPVLRTASPQPDLLGGFDIPASDHRHRTAPQEEPAAAEAYADFFSVDAEEPSVSQPAHSFEAQPSGAQAYDLLSDDLLNSPDARASGAAASHTMDVGLASGAAENGRMVSNGADDLCSADDLSLFFNGPEQDNGVSGDGNLLGGMDEGVMGGNAVGNDSAEWQAAVADAHAICAQLDEARAARVQRAIADREADIVAKVNMRKQDASNRGVVVEDRQLAFTARNAAKMQALQLQKLVDYIRSELETEARNADADGYSNSIKQEVDKWAETAGAQKSQQEQTPGNVQTLLSTLDTVLWPGARFTASKNDCLFNVDVAMKAARLLLHPDRLHNQPEDIRYRGSLIFGELNPAYRAFLAKKAP